MTPAKCENFKMEIINNWEIINGNPSFISSSVYMRGDTLEEFLLYFGEYTEIDLCGKTRMAKINYSFVFSGLATKLCSQPVYGIYKVWLSI